MSLYNARYTGLLQKLGIAVNQLPGDLTALIEKHQKSAAVLEKADNDTQHRFLTVLVQADAVICSVIYSLYKDRLKVSDIIPEDIIPPADSAKLDKIKMLALKAKALQLKAKR